MSKIILGTDIQGRTVSIDLPTLLRTRMLIASSSGGGKSWTLRRLLEQTNGKVQQIVLDYEGEFATLREKYDFVLVGKGGEVAADPRYAEQLAERLLELGASAIIDLYELKVPQRHAFVKLFLDALMNLPKELWKQCLVVVDEAHVFCPEKGKGESDASGSVIDLATRGRKRGYCAVLATQDIAKLNKDASGECRNRLVGLAVEDKTRQRAGNELGFIEKDKFLSLRDLAAGEFYAFGPALGKEVRSVNIGPVETSHPDIGTKAGRQKLAAPPPPREKVRAILSQLADLPKEAEEERQTVDSLKRRIRELEMQARQRPIVKVPEVKVERVEVPILKDGQVARLERAAIGMEKAASNAAEEWRIVRAALSSISGRSSVRPSTRNGVQPAKVPIRAITAPLVRLSPVARKQPIAHVGQQSSDSDLTGPERKLLTVLAQYHEHGRTVTQLALLAGYAKDGGAFRNPLGSLRSKGFIGGKDLLRITPAGASALGSWDPLPEPGPELLGHWMGRLTGPEREIVRVLSEVWPDTLTATEVAAHTLSSKGEPYDPDGGAFRNPLGRLRTLELVQGRGDLKLNDDLMRG